MAQNENQTTQQPQTGAIVKYENISEQVLARVNTFTEDGGLKLPKNYAVQNHMKSAWLVLQETKDLKGQPALQVCTKESIANALFDMVLQGMSVSMKQGYFIVYGNKLQFQRSYFGTVALAKRCGGIVGEPVANVIYEGDEFVYTIDPKTAKMSIIEHKQKVENIDDSKIKAAYALITRADGSTELTIMSMAQIRAAWNQGATHGASPAHKNFPAEMCKKTVIGRACKLIINSSDDAWLYDGKQDEDDVDTAQQQRNAAQTVNAEVVDFAEEVNDKPADAEPAVDAKPSKAKTEQPKDADPY